MTTIEIAGIPIGDGYPTRVCAEIGTNAGGDIHVAFEMIELAAEAGADFVKFQHRTPELAVPEPEWHELRDTPWGKMEKLEYRKSVEFAQEEYEELFAWAGTCQIPAFESVWDLPALERMEKIGSPCHKIPSARLHDDRLLAAVAHTAMPVILSTGMSAMSDVVRAVSVVEKHSDGKPDICLLQCSSAYPARADESNLRVIQTFKREFGCPVGFSSHKIGQLTCLLAVAAGANMIERHLTLDRRMKGSDHRLSTEPHELARLVREIREVEKIMGDGIKKVLESEIPEAKRLGRIL